MPISPINIVRISQNLRTGVVLDAVRQNQLDLFLTQRRIATGRTFVSPSDDPPAAGRSLQLTQAIGRQIQFARDLNHADSMLAAADSALVEVGGLLAQASSIASQNVSNLTSAAERDAASVVVAAIRQELQIVGNRAFNGRFIFAGRDTDTRPFVDALGGVAYVGDTGELQARIEDGLVASVSVPGNVLFGALSRQVGSGMAVRPQLTAATRLEDLGGATGAGVRTGQLVINEQGGAGTYTVDLTRADTIGDVVALINDAAAAAGSSLTATVSDVGIDITPGGATVGITDTSTGAIASDLGIAVETPTSAAITGSDLGVRVTRLTPVSSLAGGAGIDLAGGLVITNGLQSATVDISGAATVQDIINEINNAGVFVRARINDAGTGIEVLQQVSGVSLSIGEAGGTTASDLGIRTMDLDTPLLDLNNGLGVTLMADQDDLHIVAGDGSAFDVNLDTAVTVGDVIDLINAAATTAGVGVTASMNTTGNGIRLADTTGGAGDLVVANANGSAAGDGLGLTGPAVSASGELVGADTGPVRTESVFDALIRLETALKNDDTLGITLAAERLSELSGDVTRVHGVVGARSQSMRSRLAQMQDATIVTQTVLSEVEDLDFAEAITRMQSAQLQFQATLRTSAQLLNLSLLDFLR
ncbi:MAG: flagellin [Phycisphaerae bacterium]